MSNDNEASSIMACFKTAVDLGDNFFSDFGNIHPLDDYFLKPIKEELFHKCKGAIKEAGIYKFE